MLNARLAALFVEFLPSAKIQYLLIRMFVITWFLVMLHPAALHVVFCKLLLSNSRL